MHLVTKIMNGLGFMPKEDARALARRAAHRASFRTYAAAQVSRLTADFPSSGTAADRDIRDALEILRTRARWLCQNDPLAARFVTLMMLNVPGPFGYGLQVKSFDWMKQPDNKWVKLFDERANRMIEEVWGKWSKAPTVTGMQTLRQVEHLIMSHLARDGEFLVRKIYRKSSPFGFLLQVLEPDWLDEKRNEILADGNVIRMGIEFDKWRAPVAYHIKKVDPRLELYVSGTSIANDWERVPASEIYFGYSQERAYQSRGVPWFAPVMIRLKMLSGYEEAALVNARVAAAKMGFFYNEEGQGKQYTGEDTDGHGNFVMDADPGHMEQIPDGLKFAPWDPKFPSDQHDSFVKSCIREIASGLNVAASSLGGDLSDVNYSSIRAGMVEERESYKAIQQWMIERFMEPLFRDWLEMALLKGAVPLPAEKLDKFDAPVFSGRRWSWVDPEKDVSAKIKEIQAGLNTRTRVLAEQGEDRQDTDQELAQEKQDAEAAGLDLAVYSNPVKQPQSANVQQDIVNEAKALISNNGNH